MKFYTIKSEYLPLWGDLCTEQTVVDTDEIERLAAEWEKPVSELMEQLNETELVSIDDNLVSIDVAAALMDDDIREQLHAEGIADPQAFVDRYCELHLAKYGEPFCV